MANTSLSSALPLKVTKRASHSPIWILNESQFVADNQNATIDQPAISDDKDNRLQNILRDPQPLSEKCAVENEARQACCKTLKGDDERHLISHEVIRDVIIGLSDGLTVPFALTAGLSGLGSSRLVVTAGLAELLAGAISMGVGGYLASKAEMDRYKYMFDQTEQRVQRSCSGEMEREVVEILSPMGVRESLSRLVAQDLAGDGISASPSGIEKPVINDHSESGFLTRWTHQRKKKLPDHGLTAFLLKFGEGMESVKNSRLYISALTIGLSYFVGGLIPLIPYFTNVTAYEGLVISSIVTVVVLLIFGGFKTYFTGGKGGLGGYAFGAISTAVVGAAAAGSAYGLVKALHVEE